MERWLHWKLTELSHYRLVLQIITLRVNALNRRFPLTKIMLWLKAKFQLS